MSGRPASGGAPQGLRVEILKELQLLIDNREFRDRIDKGPLAEVKGRDHWILHLLLRAYESEQLHLDTLIGTAYGNLLSRLQALDDRVAHVEELETTFQADLRARLEGVETGLGERLDQGIDRGVGRIATGLSITLKETLDQKWKPVGESIETFAQGSKQVLKDVSDTYRVATQTRLLLNENARRITDLGRDIVALEESLKLVVAKTLEEGLGPLEQRVAALENHLAEAAGERAAPRDDKTTPASGE